VADEKFKTFVQYILDEIYLLKKLEVVSQIKSVPSDVQKAVRKVNAIRNAMAHSFFPENRKENKDAKKVMYAGKELLSRDGLFAFRKDAYNAWAKLAALSEGTPLDKVALMGDDGIVG
jgi:hypothetical protein